MAERENVARGLVPRWGRRGAWQNPPCQFAVPNHNFGFSHLGVPAPTGMSDCYESMSWTRIRDRPLRQPLIRHSRHPFVNPGPPIVIPAKAGIQKGWGGVRPPDDGQNHPAPSHFHPLMRPSRGHGDSCESLPRTPIRGQESRGEGEGKTTANLWVTTDVGESKTPGPFGQCDGLSIRTKEYDSITCGRRSRLGLRAEGSSQGPASGSRRGPLGSCPRYALEPRPLPGSLRSRSSGLPW